jgi:competence protein ComGC
MKRLRFTLQEFLVVLVIVGVLYAILVDTFGNAPFIARTTSCRSNLKATGVETSRYRRAHGSRMPQSLTEAVSEPRGVLVCSLTGYDNAFKMRTYVYRPRSRPRDIIAWDASPHIPMHSVFIWKNRPFRQVLRADGTVVKLDEDEFAALGLRGKSEILDNR